MNISFSLTTAQMYSKTKDVTRRTGNFWSKLKPGDILTAVEKSQGLKRSEKVKVIGKIQIVSVTKETLESITPQEVLREGFENMTPREFVIFFCASHTNCLPHTLVNRIEFKHLY